MKIYKQSDHPQVANIICVLASEYLGIGELEKALEYYERGSGMIKKNLFLF